MIKTTIYRVCRQTQERARRRFSSRRAWYSVFPNLSSLIVRRAPPSSLAANSRAAMTWTLAARLARRPRGSGFQELASFNLNGLCHSRESGNPGSRTRCVCGPVWIPAFAGMTTFSFRAKRGNPCLPRPLRIAFPGWREASARRSIRPQGLRGWLHVIARCASRGSTTPKARAAFRRSTHRLRRRPRRDENAFERRRRRCASARR